jgi:hypothetical protein
VVEHSKTDPKIKGSIPAVAWHQEIMVEERKKSSILFLAETSSWQSMKTKLKFKVQILIFLPMKENQP